MQFATIGEYLQSLGRKRPTLSQWLNGHQLDPWGDPVITNRAILSGCRKNIAEDPYRFGEFKDFLREWNVAARRKLPVPDYIKSASGRGRGSEEVTADDLLATEVRGRDGSVHRLWLKNREWLHVFAEDGSEARMHVDDVEETTIPSDYYWPITNAMELWADKTREHKWADDIS